MHHAGDLKFARSAYERGTNLNLLHLLKERFEWMNHFIRADWIGLELGSGIGASRVFIVSKSLTITDFNDSAWLDITNIDACKTKLPSSSYDFVIVSNIIHHLAYPGSFFLKH